MGSEKNCHHVEDNVDTTFIEPSMDEKHSVAHLPSEQQFDPKAERRLLRKIDLRLLPLIVGLHTISLIDRTNISAARIAGMDEDLGLDVGYRASIVILTFFIGYILCDIPSNIILRKIGAARFLGAITFAWGLVTIGLGCVNDWWAAAVLRVLLGVFEAGNTPGSIFLVSAWYRKFEVQTRLGYYYLFSMGLASFSSILAYGIVQIANHTEWKGWRWLFVIEGILTCVLGILGWLYLIDFPDSPRDTFLNENEKALVRDRLAADRGTNEQHHVSWKSLMMAFTDWKIWANNYMYMSATMGSYAFSFFLPIILKKSLGFSQALSFILVTPPALFAVIFGWVMARLSDKYKMRGPFVVGQSAVSIIGLGMVGYLKSPAPRMVGIFLGYAGLNGVIPCVLAWQANNCREGRKRAVASASQVMFGATGGLIASLIYRQQDAPGYVPGMTTNMVVCSVCIVVATASSLRIRKLNREADEGKRILEGLEGFRYVW